MSFLKNLLGISDVKSDDEKILATSLSSAAEASVSENHTKNKRNSSNNSSLNNSVSITTEQIYLQQKFDSKSDVLTFISKMMNNLGFVNGDYFDALMKREELVSTYLINDVAIPHGISEAKSLVKRTGVVVVQIPTGVVWNDNGDIVKLAIGIAAKSNDHLPLLQKLSAVVISPTLSKRLANTTEPNLVLQILNTEETPTQILPKGFTITAEATVVEKYGLHAEPAAILVKHAALYKNTQIHLHSGGRCANIKSMSVILMMGIQEGDRIIISAKGEHAQEAVDDLAERINLGLTVDE